MPLYIDKWISAVTLLDRADTGSYLQAVLYHWKYGPLPADLEQVCRIMKIDLGDASSIPQASPKHPLSIALAILKKYFVANSDGTWSQPTNQRIKDDWQGKRLVYNERAKKAAEARWKNRGPKKDASSIPQALLEDMLEECPVSVSLPLEQIQPLTSFGVSAGGADPANTKMPEAEANKEENRKPPRSAREGGQVGNVSNLEAARARTLGYEAKKEHPMIANDRKKRVDPRRESFKAEICRFYGEINGGKRPDKTPWGRIGDRALAELLDASSMTQAELEQCLGNYAAAVGAGEFSPTLMPGMWLRKLPNFLGVPLNRYGDPLKLKHVNP